MHFCKFHSDHLVIGFILVTILYSALSCFSIAFCAFYVAFCAVIDYACLLYTSMKILNVVTLPVVNKKDKLEGLIVTGDIAKSYMDVYDNSIPVSYTHL